jgi:hypothetical protein
VVRQPALEAGSPKFNASVPQEKKNKVCVLGERILRPVVEHLSAEICIHVPQRPGHK